MSAFIVTAFITIVVAIVFGITRNSKSGKTKDTLAQGTKKVLLALCDLQLITGTGIVVAGLVQKDTISLYHGQFILNYWWLTLTSFWAARPSYEDLDEGQNIQKRIRISVRIIMMIASIILYLVFQIHDIFREDDQWDFLDGDYCYRSHDESSSASGWLWIAGQAILAFTLCFELTRQIRDWYAELEKAYPALGTLRSTFRNSQRTLWERCRKQWSKVHQTASIVSARFLLDVIALSFCGLALAFWFSFTQFLAIWSFGLTRDWYWIELVAYVGFAAWDTFDLIDLKLSNKLLVTSEENSVRGFGQVLPLFLLFVILYGVIDAFDEQK